MKTIINRLGIEPGEAPITLEAFADKHELTMVVNERAKGFDPLMRYYAKFDQVEAMEPGLLSGTFGNGRTPAEAIANYAREIAGERLAYRASDREQRRNIQCPAEWAPSPAVTP